MARYGILICPHLNARYEQSLKQLSQAEFHLIARREGIEAEAHMEHIGPLALMGFTMAHDLTARQMRAVSRMSSFQALFEIGFDQHLLPLAAGAQEPFFDLASIMKYKGKTNETFTRFLINAALFSSEADFETDLCLLDPMCGKGTSLYCAWGYRMHAIGIEQDKKETHEASAFVKNYLQRARIKYAYTQSVRTLPKGVAPQGLFALKSSSESSKEGLSMCFLTGDARFAPAMLGKRKADIVVADLPYGILHGNGKSKKGHDTLTMLKQCLPEWRKVVKRNGTMALSFNGYTMPRDAMKEICRETGWVVQSGGAYECMEHWVEQAVLRDVMVAQKK